MIAKHDNNTKINSVSVYLIVTKVLQISCSVLLNNGRVCHSTMVSN